MQHQEWDYNVLIKADPVTRLLELAGTVRFNPYQKLVLKALSILLPVAKRKHAKVILARRVGGQEHLVVHRRTSI